MHSSDPALRLSTEGEPDLFNQHLPYTVFVSCVAAYLQKSLYCPQTRLRDPWNRQTHNGFVNNNTRPCQETKSGRSAPGLSHCTIQRIVKPWKSQIRPNNIQIFTFYFIENMLCLHHKNQCYSEK